MSIFVYVRFCSPFVEKGMSTLLPIAFSKFWTGNRFFDDFIVELRICVPVPVPEFLRSFLVLPEVLPHKGVLGCKHLFWCNNGPALHTTNVELKRNIFPSIHDSVDGLQHFQRHCCLNIRIIIYIIYVSFHNFCLHHWNKGKGKQIEKIISLREGCSWFIAVWVPPLLPPFETSTENVRRVGQDYLPRPCFCAFGAFGTWIEMVTGLGMILGATWQMGPHRQNATLYPLLFESGRVVNKVSSVSLF